MSESFIIDKQQLVTLQLIVFQTNNKIVDVNIKVYKYRLFTLKNPIRKNGRCPPPFPYPFTKCSSLPLTNHAPLLPFTNIVWCILIVYFSNNLMNMIVK